MAVRTIACLPALVGHWRRAGGGVQLSSSANFQFDKRDARAPGPVAAGAHDQHDPARRSADDARRGRRRSAGARADRLQLQSGGGRARPQRRAATGWRARICSPSCSSIFRPTPRTTPTSCCRRRRSSSTGTCTSSYGHHYVTLNQPSIEPLGEALPNSEIFRRIADAHGARPIRCFDDDDLTLIRQALTSPSRKLDGVTFEKLLEKGWMRLNVPKPYLPFADGGFLDAVGQVRALLGAHGGDGARPAADVHAAVRVPGARAGAGGALSADADLVAGTSVPEFDFREHRLACAAARASRSVCCIRPTPSGAALPPGARVVVHNDRGAFTAVARVEESIRPGVVWAPSIWWGKFAADGANANQTTSQRETDMGHGPVFYDNLVEVGLAD